MKNLVLLFLLLCLSCGEKPEEKKLTRKHTAGISEDSEFSGSFNIEKIGDEEVSSEEIKLTFDEKRKEVRGSAGCNRFSSNFKIEENKLFISEPTGTRMFCDGKMDREEQVMKILPQIKEIRETEDEIIFISETGEKLLTAQRNYNE